MSLPGREAVVSQLLSLTLECADCGRTRMRKPHELRRFGITDATRLSEVSSRLFCATCRNDGLPGRNITVQAAFATDMDRIRAEAYAINNREALYSARRAKGA
jgi:hypothetical protein